MQNSDCYHNKVGYDQMFEKKKFCYLELNKLQKNIHLKLPIMFLKLPLINNTTNSQS